MNVLEIAKFIDLIDKLGPKTRKWFFRVLKKAVRAELGGGVRSIDLGRRWYEVSFFTTKELVDELKHREAVGTHIAEPDTDLTVRINGPAIVLVIVTD